MNLTPEPDSSHAPIAILYVHSSASYYGSDNALFNMVKGLDRQRFRAIVVVPEEGPLIARLESIGVRVIRRPLAVLHRSVSPVFWLQFFNNLLRSALALRQLVRQEKISLIHSNTSHVFDGAVTAAVAGIPHLWQIREINTWRSALAPFLRVVVTRLASVIVCVSEATRSTLALPARFEHKIRVIVDGIDLAEFAAKAQAGAFRDSLGIPQEQPLIGLVGRIVQWKGHEIFIRMADKLRHRFPNARFVIIGEAVTEKDQAFQDALKQWITAHGLADSIIFAGARRDIATVMGDLDVLVVPSLNGEAWGLVTLEGMGAGTPVVASNHEGPAEIISNGQDGFLFEPANVDALERIVAELLASPTLRQSIGEAARERVRERFTLAQTVTEFSALYADMTGKRGDR